MRISGATCLLELQQLIKTENLNVSCTYVGSADAYRSIVVGPSAADNTEPVSAVGIGRDLGEAVSQAYENYRRAR